LLELFRQIDTLLEGKIVLRCGLHNLHSFQCSFCQAPKTIDIVRNRSGAVVVLGVIVDQSRMQKRDFSCLFVTLMQLNVEILATDQIPSDLASDSRSNLLPVIPLS